jgi:putative transposase
LPAIDAPNIVWALDFIEDRIYSGRKYRCLNVEDLCTRELLESEVDYSLGGARVTRVLDMLVALRGKAPTSLLTDNGPEFTSRAVLLWCQRNRVAHHFIDPGKPIQNAMMESLNGRMRDECLNGYLMETLEEARIRVAEWKRHYNEERPHSALDNMTPGDYFKKMTETLTLQSAK